MDNSIIYELVPPTTLIKKDNLPNKKGPICYFNFQPTTIKEILQIRCQGKPALFLKFQDKFYLSLLPSANCINSATIQLSHLCAKCEHCSAAPDEKGGCAKIRDLPWRISVKTFASVYPALSIEAFSNPKKYESYKNKKKRGYIRMIQESKRMEKYPFLTFALEGINLEHEFFIVPECMNFEKFNNTPPKIDSETAMNNFLESVKNYLKR